MRYVVVALAVWYFASAAFGQCKSWGTPSAPVGVPVVVQPAAVAPPIPAGAKVYASADQTWYSTADQKGYAYCVSPIAGRYSLLTETFVRWDGAKYGPPEKLPAGLVVPNVCTADCGCKGECTCNPCRCAKPAENAEQVADNFGIDPSKLGRSPRFEHNGQECAKDHVYEALANVPDMSAKRRIVVIGDSASRAAALAKIGKPEWAVVNAYDPVADWQPAKLGLVSTGAPTVYVLDSDGAVLHRQDDLAGLDVAMKRADPKYDPSTDPDLRKSAPVMTVQGWQPLAAAFIVGVVGAFALPAGVRWYLTKRKAAADAKAAQDALLAKMAELLKGGVLTPGEKK